MLNHSSFFSKITFLVMNSSDDYENNDNALLLSYQEEYLRTGSSEAWGKLFALSVKVCRNIVENRCKKNNITFDEFKKEDYSMNAAIYVLRRYKEGCRIHRRKADNKPYYISNFIVTLGYGVTHAIYSRNKSELLNERTSSLENLTSTNSAFDKLYPDQRINVECEVIDKLQKEKNMQLLKAAFYKEK